MKPIDVKLQVLMAGARLNRERSNARETRFYQDPAASVKFEREKVKQKVKRKSKGKKKTK